MGKLRLTRWFVARRTNARISGRRSTLTADQRGGGALGTVGSLQTRQNGPDFATTTNF